MPTPEQRRANNALGIFVICAITLMETVFAHHKRPSAASPYVWAGLGLGAVLSLAYWLRHRGRAPADINPPSRPEGDPKRR